MPHPMARLCDRFRLKEFDLHSPLHAEVLRICRRAPRAVQTLPIGCISLARRYMHFGGPIRRTGRPSEGHQRRNCLESGDRLISRSLSLVTETVIAVTIRGAVSPSIRL